MEAFFLDSTACVVPPMSTKRDSDGMEWVAYNKNMDYLPDEAGRFLLSTSHRESNDVGPTGLLLNMEYALAPDYHVPHLHYLAYTPTFDQSRKDLLWYQHLSGRCSIEKANDRYRVPQQFIESYKETQDNLWSCVDQIIRSPVYNNSLTPITFNFVELSILREEEGEVQRGAGSVHKLVDIVHA